MPLPSPAPRKPHHYRRITCDGFEREDGLWDIEGRITDEKTYEFPNKYRGSIKPGEFLHDMSIRLTVDDTFTIRAVEAVTDNSPFGICPNVAPNFQKLEGLRIGPGWRKKVLERLGGIHGCTHMVELLTPMATTAFQTIYPVIVARSQKTDYADPTTEPEINPMTGKHQTKPMLLNTCYAFSSDSPVVQEKWPNFYTGNDKDAAMEDKK